MSFKIIPEDAGNTLDVVEQRLLRQDHPRGYGEHTQMVGLHAKRAGSSPQMRGAHAASCTVSSWSGSSPQMRGALRLHHPPRLVLRIIPADAGSTTFASPIGKEPQDHPRRCGEHSKAGSL